MWTHTHTHTHIMVYFPMNTIPKLLTCRKTRGSHAKSVLALPDLCAVELHANGPCTTGICATWPTSLKPAKMSTCLSRIVRRCCSLGHHQKGNQPIHPHGYKLVCVRAFRQVVGGWWRCHWSDRCLMVMLEREHAHAYSIQQQSLGMEHAMTSISITDEGQHQYNVP